MSLAIDVVSKKSAEMVVERIDGVVYPNDPHDIYDLTMEQAKKILEVLSIPVPFDLLKSKFYILQVK